ncbi:MAG TPA: hypothetical protein VJ866_12305 [Pyrinomonadaceae bacterium]|nr:hypothetical protein [Pyrinomonadaceae bacterium]
MRGTLNGIVMSGRALAAVALLAAALQSDGSAQTPARRQSQSRSTPPTQAQGRERQEPRAAGANADPNADLSITARVTAESLRFEKVPNPRVEFTGRPKRDTVWESDRENLPQEVRPGVTYRNIGITLRITSVFADIDRIVAEALGEVPPTDDAQPAPTPQPPAANAQPPASNTQPPGVNAPQSDSTTPTAQPTPPAQSPTSAAAARQRRRASTRRGRVN